MARRGLFKCTPKSSRGMARSGVVSDKPYDCPAYIAVGAKLLKRQRTNGARRGQARDSREFRQRQYGHWGRTNPNCDVRTMFRTVQTISQLMRDELAKAAGERRIKDQVTN